MTLNTPLPGQGPETLPLLLCSPNTDLGSAFLQLGATLGGLSFSYIFDRYSGPKEQRFLEFLLNESNALNVNELDEKG